MLDLDSNISTYLNKKNLIINSFHKFCLPFFVHVIIRIFSINVDRQKILNNSVSNEFGEPFVLSLAQLLCKRSQLKKTFPNPALLKNTHLVPILSLCRLMAELISRNDDNSINASPVGCFLNNESLF